MSTRLYKPVKLLYETVILVYGNSFYMIRPSPGVGISGKHIPGFPKWRAHDKPEQEFGQAGNERTARAGVYRGTYCFLRQ